LDYELGRQLQKKYADLIWIEIANHNNIPELRANPNSAFLAMKRHLIVGVRKTHRYVENHKVSDFLVPYTSSGCSAACLYCYLVCTYNKCAYLRLFVNREQMLEKILKTARQAQRDLCFEIGSNSDLVLENTITGNLPWTIENFAKSDRGRLTFPTKFAMVKPLLNLDHRGRTIFRMSVNPVQIIRDIELGTSTLGQRINALNQMAASGYPAGLLLAPVVLVQNWRKHYEELIDELAETLYKEVREKGFIEIIFMTYSFVHRAINSEAFPDSAPLFDQTLMTGRGRGKYCYKESLRQEAEAYLRAQLAKKLPKMRILYIV
jgi:spore photoproduct lyase